MDLSFFQKLSTVQFSQVSDESEDADEPATELIRS